MTNKEQLILSKLLKIAQNQQKIIQKLAQVGPQTDPNVEYILRAVPVAAANVGIANVVVSKVDTNAGGPAEGGAHMETTYMAHIAGVPAQKGEAFKKAWDTQLATQKPELVGKVGFVFQG